MLHSQTEEALTWPRRKSLSSRLTDRPTNSQTNKQADRQTNIQTDIPMDTDRQMDTDRRTGRQRGEQQKTDSRAPAHHRQRRIHNWQASQLLSDKLQLIHTRTRLPAPKMDFNK